jgi:hypothetical protein
MAWVDALTGGAALLAAILAGLNLYISGRRELDKWTRETLVEIIALFLDGGFKHTGACRSMLRFSPKEKELEKLRDEAISAHSLQTHSLTRLRILAPASVVDAGRKLLESEYNLAEPCFLTDSSQDNYAILIQSDTYDTLIRPVRRDRENFIEAARSALGLREKAGTGSFEKNVSYTTLLLQSSRPMKEGEPKNSE